jgi:cytochrome c biogenesis protein CcmG/thiol:disulfide interchange protein DsbE
MRQSWWQNRWLRAAVVAVLIGAWPACRENAREIPSAGTPSLDFSLKDMDGKTVDLASFKGRPVLINFWATWCPPCKAEIPWLMEFSDKYKHGNLAVIGISVDDAPDEIRKFAAEQKINYSMLVGDGQDALKAAFDAEAVIPVSWLIKADGTLVAKAQGIHSKEWFESNIQLLF